MNVIIYDCEIINTPDQNPPTGIKKCGGWRDFSDMGISVICAYDYIEDEYRVFLEDNLGEFQRLVDSREVVVGFNSLAFDNRLCEAYGITVPDVKSYDLLCEVREACGLSRNFEDGKRDEHISLSLDALSMRNFGLKKSGHGAQAPILWQQGKYGAVVDYCLRDVLLTKRLLNAGLGNGIIIDDTGDLNVDQKFITPIRFCEKCGCYLPDWDKKNPEEKWRMKICSKCPQPDNNPDFDENVPF